MEPWDQTVIKCCSITFDFCQNWKRDNMVRKTRSSVGCACVAHLSFCLEETLYRTFHRCQAVDDEGDTILFSLENTTYSIGIPSLSSDGM
jgi:hypothetical protein